MPRTSPSVLGDPGQAKQLDSNALRILEEARQNFDKAIGILETELATRGDYASILALAPQLRGFAPNDARLLWMHALALAATGSLADADKTLALASGDAAASNSPLPLLAQGMLDLRRGRPQDAAEQVRAAIGRAPDNAYAHNLLGMIQSELGDPAAAGESFARATELAPAAGLFWRNLGIVRFQQEQIPEAEAALQKALEINPTDCVALSATAQIYEAALQPAKAEGFVRQCLDAKTGDTGQAAGYLVSLLVAQNKFEEARATVDGHTAELPAPQLLRAELDLFLDQPQDALTDLKTADPGASTDLRRWLAMAMSGDTAAALEAVRTARAAGNTSVDAAFTEVALAAAAGQPLAEDALKTARSDASLGAPVAWFVALASASTDGAAAAAKAATAADGMLPGVRFIGLPDSDWQALRDPAAREQMALGVLWVLRDFALPAAAAFADVLKTADVQQARYFKALAEVKLDHQDVALQTLKPAADALPGYFSAQVLMGELHLRFRDFDGALASYRNAAAAEPDGGVLMRVGVLADMLDKPDVAETALRKFIELFPDSMIGYNQLAWVFAQREVRLDEALALANRADQLQPGNASVLDNIGWIMFLKGDTAAALGHLREANTRSGNQNPDILYHLAAAEAAGGAAGTSRKLLDRLFEVAPADYPAALKGRELLARLSN